MKCIWSSYRFDETFSLTLYLQGGHSPHSQANTAIYVFLCLFIFILGYMQLQAGEQLKMFVGVPCFTESLITDSRCQVFQFWVVASLFKVFYPISLNVECQNPKYHAVTFLEYCQNPNLTSIQPQHNSWVQHVNDCAYPPHHRNSISAISQLLLTRF